MMIYVGHQSVATRPAAPARTAEDGPTVISYDSWHVLEMALGISVAVRP